MEVFRFFPLLEVAPEEGEEEGRGQADKDCTIMEGDILERKRERERAGGGGEKERKELRMERIIEIVSNSE